MTIRKKRVDEDWKQQAEREKERMAAEDEALRGGASPGEEVRDEAPAAAAPLTAIFEQLAGQAMTGLGQVPDPRTGMRGVDLEMARYAIDILGSLEIKTRGRLDPEEKQVLEELLPALRSAYVQVQAQVARRAPTPPPSGEGAGR